LPSGLDAALVHAANEEVRHLAPVAAGRQRVRSSRKVLDQRTNEFLVRLFENRIDAPIGTIGRYGVGFDPTAVRK